MYLIGTHYTKVYIRRKMSNSLMQCGEKLSNFAVLFSTFKSFKYFDTSRAPPSPIYSGFTCLCLRGRTGGLFLLLFEGALLLVPFSNRAFMFRSFVAGLSNPSGTSTTEPK